MGLNAACSILELGGDVVCFDRMERPLSELWCSFAATSSLSISDMLTTAKADALKEKHDGQLTYCSLDISNADTILPSFQTALRNVRYPLRGLVACAGISDGDATVDFSLDRVKRLLDVNVTGTFACSTLR